jgi:hypothetical protein
MSCAVLAGACREPRFPAVPGDTTVSVIDVHMVPRAGETISVDYDPLLATLGLRAKSLLLPARDFNAFRLAEDRRRIVAYLEEHGHFDAEVDEPLLDYAPDLRSVAVAWTVHEGVAYHVASVTLVGAPPDEEERLRSLVPFEPGSGLDLPVYRGVRELMAEHMQAHGYAHARAYSRAFVDRAAKAIAWFYYCDPGPATRVGSLAVEGNLRVPADKILARAGLAVGQPFSTERAHRAELALLDTGAFASAAVVTDADIQRLPEFPDSGGVLAPDRIAADGELVPRQLSDELAVRVVVVEAPARQLRSELGIEGDPTRVDAFTGTRVVFRNLFGTQQHLVLEGTVGYGWLTGVGLGGEQLAGGVYGSALAQYQRPGWLARRLDLRITARWRDELYPAAMLREVVVGPGVRSTLAPGWFFDLDAYARFARTLDQPMLDPASTAGLALPAGTDSSGAEVVSSLIVDRRDDRVEPTRGWLLGLGASYSPGGALADHRWLQLTPDARWIAHMGGIDSPWSLALRASGGVVLLPDADGVPLGARLFGGGAYGMRGFGRDQLSPAACVVATACQPVLVGGRSLFEGSAELRMLPFRKQYGLATFVDTGAAGAGTNAFADGVSVAYGVGLRVRLWYLPLALDVAYRVVDEDKVGLAADRVLAFVRVGEAF